MKRLVPYLLMLVSVVTVWMILESAYQLGRRSVLVNSVPCSPNQKVHSVSPRFVVQPPPYSAAPLTEVNSPYRPGRKA